MKDGIKLQCFFIKKVFKNAKQIFSSYRVSSTTLQRINRETDKHSDAGTSINTVGKKHNVPKKITEVDNFYQDVARCTIYNLYVQEGLRSFYNS